MQKRNLVLAYIATIVQYYDYALFGISATALTKAYIPASSNQFIAFFSIISCAAIMKPIGSLIFGSISDKKSRALALQISVLIASLSTIIIGLIPSHNTIISATILLLSRMMFITSMAGEGDGVRIYVAETIGCKKEFFGNGVVTFCSQTGVLVASLFWWITSHYDTSYEIWRINFIIGGVLGVIIFIFRRYITEPISDNKIIKEKITQQHIPLFIKSVVIAGCIGGIYHFQIIFFSTFMSTMIHVVDQISAAKITSIGIILYSLSALCSGYMADKFYPSKQIIISLTSTVILCLSLCYALSSQMHFVVILSLLITTSVPFYSVPLQIILKRNMPKGSVLRTFSLAHSIGSIIFSSSVPLISTILWESSHKPWMPVIYATVLSILLLCVYLVLKDKTYAKYDIS